MSEMPIPKIYPHTQAFWEGTKKQQLLLPYCNRCTRFFFYPRVCCPACFGTDVTMQEIDKKGTIETFSTLAYPPSEAFASKVPYTLGVIRLSVGTLIFMEIKGDPQSIQVGASGTIGFEQRGELFLPVFLI